MPNFHEIKGKNMPDFHENQGIISLNLHEIKGKYRAIFHEIEGIVAVLSKLQKNRGKHTTSQH